MTITLEFAFANVALHVPTSGVLAFACSPAVIEASQYNYGVTIIKLRLCMGIMLEVLYCTPNSGTARHSSHLQTVELCKTRFRLQ